MMDLFLINTAFHAFKALIDGLDFGLDYCDVFISLDSYSDDTHSLQRIHWWASDITAKFLQMWFNIIYIVDDLRASTFSEYIFLVLGEILL